MADGLMFNMIETLIAKMVSMGSEAWNVRDDLEKLEDNMAEIKAVVLDAEEKQGTNRQVQLWLEKLKEALYDVEDLLDDVSTEELGRQVITRGKKAKKVRVFLSSSNQLVFSFKMAQKIKELKNRIEALNVDKRVFNFTDRNPEQRVLRQRETHSFVRGEQVIGREVEMKELVELLLNTDISVEENVSIISIVGIGGLGKTTLAQLVFNHEAVHEHFEMKKWVCVSDDFDVKTIASTIIDSKTDLNMDQVQQELRKKVEGRRYLLVLDDIWNDKRECWLRLMTLLMDGAKGSKIIITTRSEAVARVSGTSSFFFLKGLDEEQSWKLFSKLAWNGQEPENQNLVPIGKEIVKKCSGVPLAISSIGSLMYSKVTENEWLNFKEKDLVKIDEQGEKGVLQLIKLSYDHLPFHLKKCFSLCSLFPKDYSISRPQLIGLWIAHGFVQSSDETTSLEDIGDEYFMHLAQRCFFQNFDRDKTVGRIWWCSMHDIVHDLAQLVSGNDCFIVNKKSQHIPKQTRHLSFDFLVDSSWEVPSSLSKAQKLRTFLLPLHDAKARRGELSGEEFACNMIVSCFKPLRVLDLNNLNLKKTPSCIGMLKHLRYLNLSYNKRIEALPSSITKLYNLQTLLLNDCSMLRELPRDLWKLVSLRHLDLDGCDKLSFLPRGIGQLTNLQTLTTFALDRTSNHSAGAKELGGLNNLRGHLHIKGLECLRPNLTEVRDINLKGKPRLESLVLTWDNQIDADDSEMDKDNIILQGLLPHLNINGLSIGGFGGAAISSSVNSFTNLLSISLDSCTRLQYLPHLHHLSHLKLLCLSRLPCLEWIAIDGSSDGSSTFFPSLREIELFELTNLKGFCRCSDQGMPSCCHRFKNSLEYLSIGHCPNLMSFPQHTDLELLSVSDVSEKILLQAVNQCNVQALWIYMINDLKSLSGVLQHLTMLRNLEIANCEELDPCNDEDGCYSLQWKELKNLYSLEFSNIAKMESLPEGLQHVTTLEMLRIADCANLTHIPEWVTSLQVVKIRRCPKLSNVPEGVKVEED